jgi:carbon-monoxide dehydrogenase medium subunit
MLRPFQVLFPTSLEEASSALARHGERARVYAGGAELVLLMRYRGVRADYLVDIKSIPDLHTLVWDGRAITIGAAVSHRRVETHDAVRRELPMLASAESCVGNIRVRNQGTLGGNLCFNDPHSDPIPPLLVYNATVTLAGREGRRELLLDDFLLATNRVALGPDEILSSIGIAPLPPGWGEIFVRIDRFCRLNVAEAGRTSDGRIDAVRLAVGCVGPRAFRLRELEARLRGATPSEGDRLLAQSKAHLVATLQPTDELTGSADYKVHVASALLRRGLHLALAGPKR